jgi:uncharacterized cupredoxin-like copper-binding protein
MPRPALAFVLLATLLGAAGCAGRPPPPSPPAEASAATPTANADWSKAETVTVAMTDFRFAPSTLVLKHGTPYRLHFENRGSGVHDFTAPDFLKASAIDAGRSAAGGIAPPPAERVVLRKGEEKDLYLVPLRPGSYDLVCDEFLHEIFGMTGHITVE